ncbi:MAG: transglutaminase-like domain-containing protein [Gemmatimonadales bacterium]
MTRRTTAWVVLGVWLVALGWLVKREFLVPAPEPLTLAALSLPPGANYYALTLAGQQVGFASTTIDTLPDTLRVTDVIVLDLPVMGTRQRTDGLTEAILTRELSLRSFTASLRTTGTRYAARGVVSGDTLLTVEMDLGTGRDTLRIPLEGPIVLPSVVPLTVAFGGRLEIGRSVTLRLFDPAVLAQRPTTFRVVAESTFVFPDSAQYDSTLRRFVPATYDTVQAWAVVTEDTRGLGATTWIDARGNVVHASTPVGFHMARSAFELAYENFRQQPPEIVASLSSDIIQQTAIGAGVRLDPANLRRLTVRIGGAPLAGYDLPGGRQQLTGDTLTVTRETPSRRGGWRLGRAPDSLTPWLAAEPLVQSTDTRIAAQARQVIGGTRDPRTAAERLTQWVYGNLRKEITVSIPSALDVLARRSGDCNEHTVLYVAMARAVGLPARTAAGVVYLDGRFFYHAWPEVYLDDTWVAVDPTFGQFPADAAHLRFTIGGLARQMELIPLIGRLTLDVLDQQS